MRRRKICQPASPQGWIPIIGMHGSESKAGAGILGAYPLSREASEGDGHRWQHDLWNIHRRERGGLVIRDVVWRLLTEVGKSKPTPICPYLLHLYIAHDVVQAEDKRVYMVGESFMRHKVDPNKEEESVGSESSERESLTSREIRELQQQKEKKETFPPQRKVMPTSSRKDKAPHVEERVEEPKKKNPFQVIADSLNEIRERCRQTRKLVRATCTIVGAKGEDTLVETSYPKGRSSLT